MSRLKGFNLQQASRDLNGLLAIKVDRSTPLGNPFVVGIDGTVDECVDLYEHLLAGTFCLTSKASLDAQRKARTTALESLDEIQGMNLACWCSLGSACHGDVLLRVANSQAREAAT